MINQKILLKKPKFNKNLMKKGLKYGIPLIPSAIFAWGLYSADNISLRAWSNFTEIGLYSAATKITMFLTIIKTSFSTFWVPTYFRWHENGEAKYKFIKVSQLVSTALFIIFCLVVIFKDIIILVFDQRYHEAIFIVPFLLFFSLLYTISETTNMGIFLSRKTFYSMLATGLALVINFSGNYFLIPKMGGIGASISTAFAFLAYFWVNTLASRRLWYKFEIKFYVVNLLLLFILAGISVFYHNTIIELLMFGLIIIYNHNHVKHLAELAFGQLKLLTHKMKW
jgi:O-antigen/teichoic acid export membrane protein